MTVAEIDGKVVVAAEVPEIAASQKPCFYKPAGLQGGSYIRVGNTNRQMNDYEIFGYTSLRVPHAFDEDTVPGAAVEDLDRARVDDYLSRLRRERPAASCSSWPAFARAA